MNGDENFDVIFSSTQSVFAMRYFDDAIQSTFNLTFLNGVTTVEISSFVSGTPFDTSKFVAFVSDVSFDTVRVREDDGTGNANEFFQFFQFFSAPTTGAPKQATIELLGLAFLSMSRARRNS